MIFRVCDYGVLFTSSSIEKPSLFAESLKIQSVPFSSLRQTYYCEWYLTSSTLQCDVPSINMWSCRDTYLKLVVITKLPPLKGNIHLCGNVLQLQCESDKTISIASKMS